MSEFAYLNMLHDIMEQPPRGDRTGTGTRSVFGGRLQFDLNEGFPLLTTKRVNFRAVVAELLWILSGSTNVNDLDSDIWLEWSDENGDLGPVYGRQWRTWPLGDKPIWVEEASGDGIDQIAKLRQGLKENPTSRRHVVSAWNVAALPRMALEPCHMMFQCYVDNEERLHLQMYQRSADMFLGVPFNIASYALLTHLLAHDASLKVGTYTHIFGDAHIYLNHTEQVQEQWFRQPRGLPKLWINPLFNFDNPKAEFITVEGYNPHPAIKGEVSV